MRLHRFYIAVSIGAKTEISISSADLVHQIRRVFRLETGDSVILFDGSGFDFTCRIKDIVKEDVSFTISSLAKSHYIPDREVTLCMALVKKDTFEWIVQKATELGVTKIIPVIADRSEKKNLNEERLKKIVTEASEQSGRGNVPTIHPIIDLKECSEWCSKKEIPSVAFHIEGEILNESARWHLAEKSQLEIFIGPEGGWSPDEIEMFHKNKIPIYSLGKQVLRAETAVVSALSLTLLGK